MMLRVVIYSKKDCMKCRQTALLCKLEKEVRLVTEAEIEHIKSLGVRTMPYVEVYRDNKKLDSWSNFQIEKIQKWNKALTEEK